MDWQHIQHNLATMSPVEGGFTNATRGIITTADGQKLFVKIGIDDITKKWAQKEVGIYKTLAKLSYVNVPKLVATNDNMTGFALEYLGPDTGWEWETAWTVERVGATLAALDSLAALPHDSFAQELLIADEAELNPNPWTMTHVNDAARSMLQDRLRKAGKTQLAELMDDLRSSFHYTFACDTLVHFDVRRDNCAWNPGRRMVRLVDWNWLHLGDRDIDLAALLVNIHKSGMDVTKYKGRLNRDALLWLSGEWLASSIKPGESTMADPEVLRGYQFDSALAAYELAIDM